MIKLHIKIIFNDICRCLTEKITPLQIQLDCLLYMSSGPLMSNLIK